MQLLLSASIIVAYVLSYGQVINVRWFLFYLANEAVKAFKLNVYNVGHQVPLDAICDPTLFSLFHFIEI